MAMAIHGTMRAIVLSMCECGRARPWELAGTLGNLWRTSWEIQPEWSSVTTILDRQAELHPYSGPDHWNDPDMLEVGNGLTASEDRAHFGLWAVLAAPIMAGNDLRQMSDGVRAILTATEIVAIDQDALGIQARRVRREEEIEVWVRGLAGTRAFAVALFNRGPQDRELRAGLVEIGFASSDVVRVRDLWLRSDLGVHRREILTTLPSHSAAFLRVCAY